MVCSPGARVRGLVRLLAERATRLRAEERGDLGAAVIVTPVFIMAVMLVIQAALLFHARTLISAAASDAARATQAESGTVADGHAVACGLIGDGGLLEDPSVDITRTPTEVQVTITTGVQSLVPFWDPEITATAVGPVEVFISEAERP